MIPLFYSIICNNTNKYGLQKQHYPHPPPESPEHTCFTQPAEPGGGENDTTPKNTLKSKKKFFFFFYQIIEHFS